MPKYSHTDQTGLFSIIPASLCKPPAPKSEDTQQELLEANQLKTPELCVYRSPQECLMRDKLSLFDNSF